VWGEGALARADAVFEDVRHDLRVLLILSHKGLVQQIPGAIQGQDRQIAEEPALSAAERTRRFFQQTLQHILNGIGLGKSRRDRARQFRILLSRYRKKQTIALIKDRA